MTKRQQLFVFMCMKLFIGAIHKGLHSAYVLWAEQQVLQQTLHLLTLIESAPASAQLLLYMLLSL